MRQDINKGDQDHLSLVLNNTHALWKVVPTDPVRADHASTNIVYLDRPYCSLSETTEKDGVVRKLYSVVARDETGQIGAAMYVSLKDVNTEPEIVFLRRINFFNIFTKNLDYREKISFFRQMNRHSYPESQAQWWVQMMAKVFGATENEITERLLILHGNFQDKLFVKRIFEMSDEISKRDEAD